MGCKLAYQSRGIYARNLACVPTCSILGTVCCQHASTVSVFPCQAQHTALLVPTTHAHHATFCGPVVTACCGAYSRKCVWNIDSSGYMYSGGWETFTTVYISLTQKASIYVQVQYVWYNSISSGSAWKPVIDNTFSF